MMQEKRTSFSLASSLKGGGMGSQLFLSLPREMKMDFVVLKEEDDEMVKCL